MMSDDKKSSETNTVNDQNTSNEKDDTVKAQQLPDDIVYPKGIKLFLIILALCLAVLLVALDQTIIATAIPRITDRFNSVQDIGWYGSVSPTTILTR
jgi:hypothetical protein